jgi:D-alanine-D-alanine ligase
MLPVAEITYVDYPDGKPKILAQAAKWDVKSFESLHTGSRYDFPTTDWSLIDELREKAAQCVKLFKLTGWGRVDFRCAANGAPFIIDINSGSCLAEDAWFAGSLKKIGVDFDVAMEQVMNEAING